VPDPRQDVQVKDAPVQRDSRGRALAGPDELLNVLVPLLGDLAERGARRELPAASVDRARSSAASAKRRADALLSSVASMRRR